MKKGNIAVFVLISLAGLGLIAFAVWSYFSAEKESKRIYDEMVAEAKKEEKEEKEAEERDIYGFGAALHPGLGDKESVAPGPVEPAIFIYPKEDKKE